MESKNIVRVEKNKDYTIINNTSIRDERLSWKAKAIHVFMLSKPDNWEFYNEEMMKWATDGKASFNSGLKELKDLGYVKKVRRNNPDGTFDWVTIVYEVPQPCTEKRPMDEPYTDYPSMEKPLTVKPSMDNQPLLITNALSTESLSTNALINNNNNNRSPAYTEPPPKQLNAFQFYEQNGFGILAHHIALKLDGWINDMSEPLVIRAMERSVENGVYTWSYVETILKGWFNKRLTTIEAVEAEELRWKAAQHRKQSKQQAPYRKGREEQVPDWFYNRNENANEDAAPQPISIEVPVEPTMDFEAERQKILAMLGKTHEKYEKGPV
ncbi:MAG: DnaD domain protein [Lysinibacillus sp.]